ncbi:MAG: hypothetical protein NMK33_04285 [Candidatus Cardinium sp.]|mgnify:CR=1 FL=1|uniref:hypothetical protein n=1 Tax=Cardinium endosymbiont of Dermatophagoides farinae TaxID=2597823 RepID=UPI0016423AE4|nr:hypothetical protein [Cardinium endosymbiont of Dermatophagoides farinae]UWW96647.1 MAG: hypothetical protein NMK33_04285 [Candidatus Cardinium sp.]
MGDKEDLKALQLKGDIEFLECRRNKDQLNKDIPLSFSSENKSFELTAFCLHRGNDSGHYIGYVKLQGVWYKVDGSRVERIGEAINGDNLKDDATTVVLLAYKRRAV